MNNIILVGGLTLIAMSGIVVIVGLANIIMAHMEAHTNQKRFKEIASACKYGEAKC